MTEWIPAIVAAVAAAGGIIGTLVTAKTQRTRTDAEASSVLTDIALKLVEPLQGKVAEMEGELMRMERKISLLEKENALLHRWSQLLFTQVVEAGHDPYTFEYVRKLSDE